MKSDKQVDVLIVGAGPTGLMMACQLALRRVSFRIIDKTEDHTTQSRALVMQARSVEIFHQMGLAEKAIAEGKIAKAAGAFFNGKKVMRLTLGNVGAGLTRFPFLLMLEQSRTESILLEFLQTQGHQVERKVELISISQQSDEVNSLIKKPDDTEEIINSKFVIGADGAHSIVRRESDIHFEGKTYEQSLFLVDCKAKVDIPDDEMYLAFSEDGIGGFFPLTNGRWRILGTLPAELEGKEDITFADIEKDFAKRVRMKVELYDPQWVSAYKSHHRHATTFRKDRCFLVGDAAHIHSPVGAQGMNTGLQDAYNLAWKLSLVIDGTAKENLLDTYNEERIKVARQLVRSTDRAFNMLTSSHLFLKTFRLTILPLAFKFLAPVFQKLTFLQRMGFGVVSEIGIQYRESSLSQHASLGSFPKKAPKPGDRLPYFLYRNEKQIEVSIQDIMSGKNFCMLVLSNALPQELAWISETQADWFSTEIISRNAGTENLYSAFGIKNEGYFLIRPDMYIAYRAAWFDHNHLLTYLRSFLHIP